jgi:hypothetical protein
VVLACSLFFLAIVIPSLTYNYKLKDVHPAGSEAAERLFFTYALDQIITFCRNFSKFWPGLPEKRTTLAYPVFFIPVCRRLYGEPTTGAGPGHEWPPAQLQAWSNLVPAIVKDDETGDKSACQPTCGLDNRAEQDYDAV